LIPGWVRDQKIFYKPQNFFAAFFAMIPKRIPSTFANGKQSSCAARENGG